MHPLNAIWGGLIAGFGLGGCAAAVIESLAPDTAGSTTPIVIAGGVLGVGIGVMLASLSRKEPD